MPTLEPGNILRVSCIEIAAAKLKMAPDKSMGVESEPAVVAVANAKRHSPSSSEPASGDPSAGPKGRAG